MPLKPSGLGRLKFKLVPRPQHLEASSTYRVFSLRDLSLPHITDSEGLAFSSSARPTAKCEHIPVTGMAVIIIVGPGQGETWRAWTVRWWAPKQRTLTLAAGGEERHAQRLHVHGAVRLDRLVKVSEPQPIFE